MPCLNCNFLNFTCVSVFKIFLYRLLDRAYDILFIDGSFSFADRRLIVENRILLEFICGNIPLYINNFLTNILLSEKKYTNKDMMLEWRKQAGQMGKMQMTLCNTANSLIGSLNRNTQQSDDSERKPKKRKQQKADSSDDADQY